MMSELHCQQSRRITRSQIQREDATCSLPQRESKVIPTQIVTYNVSNPTSDKDTTIDESSTSTEEGSSVSNGNSYHKSFCSSEPKRFYFNNQAYPTYQEMVITKRANNRAKLVELGFNVPEEYSDCGFLPLPTGKTQSNAQEVKAPVETIIPRNVRGFVARDSITSAHSRVPPPSLALVDNQPIPAGLHAVA
jgi:hypothetical protein